MKVRDALRIRDKLQVEFSNLQHLELLFINDKNLAEEVGKKAECDMPVDQLITEVRMRYSDLISDWNNKVGDLDIQ